MSRDSTIEVLNELIRTSEDGRRGFEAAAAKADDPRLKTTLAEHARSCAAAVSELQQLVRSFGGEPVESGSIAGAAHRGWVRARAAAGDNNVAVLEEVERGEDVAKAAYTRAL
ncbi:MAG: PA2169 family four-helix-bundle protein, partial [Pseudomonadota bacterium]